MGRPNGRIAGTAGTDVGRARERRRRDACSGSCSCVLPLWVWLTARAVTGEGPPTPSLPQIDPLVLVPGAVLRGAHGRAARHVGGCRPVTARAVPPEQIDVRLDDVVGIDPVKDEVVRSAGAVPRRTARSAARWAGAPPRPALRGRLRAPARRTRPRRWPPRPGCRSCSSPRPRSSRCTTARPPARSARYFRALRKAARGRGRRDRLHRGDRRDRASPVAAVGHARRRPRRRCLAVRRRHAACGGLAGLPRVGRTGPAGQTRRRRCATRASARAPAASSTSCWCRCSRSTRPPAGSGRRPADRRRQPVPARRPAAAAAPARSPPTSCSSPRPTAPTSLDPALLRPGRFDRRLTFDLPGTRPAAASSSTTSWRARRTTPAAGHRRAPRRARRRSPRATPPSMIEHLLDEALVHAVRRGGAGDVLGGRRARAAPGTEVGLGQPVGVHRRTRSASSPPTRPATPTVAWLVAPHRRLEVLTIVKRARRARTARARRRGGRLHALPAGVARPRSRSRSAARSPRSCSSATSRPARAATCLRDRRRGPDGRRGRYGRHAWSRSPPSRTARSPTPTSSAGCWATPRAAGSSRSCSWSSSDAVRELLGRHRHLVAALRDALLDRHELIGSEITDVLEAAAREASGEGSGEASGEGPVDGSPTAGPRGNA